MPLDVVGPSLRAKRRARLGRYDAILRCADAPLRRGRLVTARHGPARADRRTASTGPPMCRRRPAVRASVAAGRSYFNARAGGAGARYGQIRAGSVPAGRSVCSCSLCIHRAAGPPYLRCRASRRACTSPVPRAWLRCSGARCGRARRGVLACVQLGSCTGRRRSRLCSHFSTCAALACRRCGTTSSPVPCMLIHPPVLARALHAYGRGAQLVLSFLCGLGNGGTSPRRGRQGVNGGRPRLFWLPSPRLTCMLYPRKVMHAGRR